MRDSLLLVLAVIRPLMTHHEEDRVLEPEGYSRVVLWVFEGNERARIFYEAKGPALMKRFKAIGNILESEIKDITHSPFLRSFSLLPPGPPDLYCGGAQGIV